MRHTDTRIGCTIERQPQRRTNTHTAQTLHELLRLVMVILVNQFAHTHVARHHQHMGHINRSISTSVPVVVFHHRSIHVADTASRFHIIRRLDVPIIQCHQDGSRLECGTWLHQSCQGIVTCLIIFTVVIAHQVHNRLHIARLHFHQHHHTHLGIQLMQFLTQRALTDVLHAHIDGAHQVIAVHWFLIHNGKVFRKHLLVVHLTRNAPQKRVVSQFQARTGRVFGTEHLTQRTTRQ